MLGKQVLGSKGGRNWEGSSPQKLLTGRDLGFDKHLNRPVEHSEKTP